MTNTAKTMTAAEAYDFAENNITFHKVEVKSFADFAKHIEDLEFNCNDPADGHCGDDEFRLFGYWAARTVRAWYNKFFKQHLSFVVVYTTPDGAQEVAEYTTEAKAARAARTYCGAVADVMSDYCNYTA